MAKGFDAEKFSCSATGASVVWAKRSGEEILETRLETRVGGIDVEDKGTLSLLVNGEPDVGEV